MQRSREDSQADRPDPGSAVAELVADHERVPEKNRACKGCSKVRSGARFMYGMGPNREADGVVGPCFESQTSTVSR